MVSGISRQTSIGHGTWRVVGSCYGPGCLQVVPRYGRVRLTNKAQPSHLATAFCCRNGPPFLSFFFFFFEMEGKWAILNYRGTEPLYISKQALRLNKLQ